MRISVDIITKTGNALVFVHDGTDIINMYRLDKSEPIGWLGWMLRQLQYKHNTTEVTCQVLSPEM